MVWLGAYIYDPFMRGAERACFARWRAALLEAAEGAVLDLGAGTGVNLQHLAARVRTGEIERLVAVEPDGGMLRQLGPKAQGLGIDVEQAQAPAERLPFADESFDVVVSTLVLCSVTSVERSLDEVRRVLRPGGRLLFMEHVAAEGRPERLKWQRRVEPVWKRIAGNCHLARQTERHIREAGFEVDDITRESIRKSMPIVRPSIRGIARKS